MPLSEVTTTGIPAAMASNATRPNPSDLDGIIITDALQMSDAISLESDVKGRALKYGLAVENPGIL
jgi:hypothetical protein